MKLINIRLRNYKVFKELYLDLSGKSTVLFGVNGVGKSTVLSAISFIFRVFLNQMNPAQSKAFEKFQDDMLTVGSDCLEIQASVKLMDTYLLARNYRPAEKNSRSTELTYSKVNYSAFKEKFKQLYLSSDEIGMPIFVHYGTNRAVLNIPDKIRGKQSFDKLSAIERAIDYQTDFQSFFEWYRDKEADEIIKARDYSNYEYRDPALACVRRAIEAMIGDVSGLRIKRDPVRMVVDKSGKEVRVDMLSDGEKCTLALLGDLAKRLVLANPKAEDPLNGSGIVLIDEVELHMHPSWQRRILRVLREVFPNIQFIVTTHSPQVLGEANDGYVIISLGLDSDGYGIAETGIRRMDGYDSNMILEEFMETSSESSIKKDLVKSVNEAIRKGEFEFAERKLEELKELAGSDDEEYILAKGYLLRRRVK